MANLAGYYRGIGKYNEAIRKDLEALEIRTRVLGTNHLDYTLSLNALSIDYCELGNFNEAIRLGKEALQIRGAILGLDHPDYANTLGSLAGIYSEFGDYNEAIQLETKALQIYKAKFGVESPSYAFSLSNLAVNYSEHGDYNKAVQLEKEALRIRKKAFGADNPKYASSLSNLATNYSSLGNYDEAIRLQTEALQIRESKLGEDHPDYANSLGNLASYYALQGDYNEAKSLGTKALQITKKYQGTEHPDYAWCLSNLTWIYSKLGNYKEAIRFGTEALQIRKEVLGIEHPSYAVTLSNLAMSYADERDFNKAIQLGTEALLIYEKTLGTNHPYNATALSDLANYYAELGGIDEAIPFVKKYGSLVKSNALSTFSGLTANERLLYWDQYKYRFNSWIPRILIKSGTTDVASIIYDNTALFAKGLLLNTEQEMSKIIQESGDDEALRMYSELRQNRLILNAQYSKPIAERYYDCDSLEGVSANLERELVTRIKEFGDFTRNLSITWCDVQNQLGEDDIAIEFLSYQENDSTTAYAALTLCKSDTTPALTQLFTEHELIEESGDDETYLTSKADELIWGTLASRLEGKTHIYFSATGLLHNIGIEYLPSMEGKECHRLSSTRELVTHHTSSTISSATLYGGIDYKASYASIESSIPNSVKDYAMTASTSQYRGRFDYRTLRYGVSALPGTKEEITEVSAMLKPLGTSFEILSGTQASEESFKALSGQRKSLIHIATHGFYYNSEEADNLSDNMRLMFIGENRPRNVEDQSLLRCGLCFAGANQILSGESQPSDGQDDGILNALEIAQTDLRGLDLVVLSACQTALGDIAQGEGVFGLQRGFKKAGAQSILMSLWEVDNDATHLLMTEFYKGWTSGLSKYTALRQAQAVVKEKYPDPKYWAAFILLDAID